ncbi:GNAT family N-acetyltransferase [Alphaproteobacteria bacterium]|nr:GNAT family N-acetyltransferase [Alphaproteobacteria bacterium]
MSPKITPALPEHLGSIAALEAQLFERGLRHDALQSLAKGTAFRGFVIVKDDADTPDNHPIAYILAHVTDDGGNTGSDTGSDTGGNTGGNTEGEILSLGTDPAYYRRGFASALCRHLIDQLGPKAGLFLEVAEDNHAAKQLYEGLGFRPIAVRRDYYKRANGVIDAIVMRRDNAELDL